MRRALLIGVWTALFLALIRVAAAAPRSPGPEGNSPRASPARPTRAPQSQSDSQWGLDPFWTAPITGLTHSLAWGDADLDGDLDLLLANDGLNRLYENQGGTLTETWAFDVQDSRSAAWGDYDRDGFLDIAVGNFGYNRVYHNDGNLTFSQAWQASVVTDTTSVAWAGWEIGSEYRAFLAVGVDGGPNGIYGYQSAAFAPVWTATLVSATQSLAWGDYDRDGDPDLAVGNASQATLIYRNDRTLPDPLVLVHTTTEVSQTCSLAWGDMDGDGYLDLAVGNKGPPGAPQADQVYCNGGPPGYGFSVCWTSDDASPTSQVAWGDHDGDGDLDLAATSQESVTPTRLYLNKGGLLSRTPIEPLSDAETDARAVGWADFDGDGDLELTVAAYASTTVVYANTNGCFTVTDISPDLLDSSSLAWGDLNDDGRPDLAVGNTSWGKNQVFSSTGQGFSLSWSSPENEHTRSVAWGDFDGDGRLDLAAGNSRQVLGWPSRFYPGEGGTFGPSWTFGEGDTYSLAWGDFDGDQDLDLAVGNYGQDEPNQVFVSGASVGTLGFIDVLELAPASDQTRSVAWADFDQDGDLDLAVGNRNGPNRVYLNQGPGSLSTSITLPGAGDTFDLAWADWDGDGDLDLAVGDGGAGGHVEVLAAKQVSGAWTFEQVFASPESIDVRSVGWGDYDGDGDPDLAVGIGPAIDEGNALYRNESGTLRRWWRAPPAGQEPTNALAWADPDRDGDLDLAVANASSWPNRLYVNNRLGPAALANDPAYAVIDKPGHTPEAAFFANYKILGEPTITISYTLYDDEGDRVFRLDPLVSWNGGGRWEAALEAGGDGTLDLAASPSPTGTEHVFVWDALSQLLAHQGTATPPPAAQPRGEMDVALRLIAWSNPEHGGLIQRPTWGTDTTLFRIDVRPDWYDSGLQAEPGAICPGETVTYTLRVTSAGHGLLPGAIITIPLPAELTLLPPPVWNQGNTDWSTEAITWTGTLSHQQVLSLAFQARASQPLTDGLSLDLDAHIFDGLHAPFARRVANVVESAPFLSGSHKLVNGQPANAVPPGSPLAYTLVLSNSGSDNARDVTLTDALAPALIWAGGCIASDGTASYANRVVAWQGDVNVGAPVTITYHVTLVNPLAGNTLITNTAHLSAANLAAFQIAPPVTTTVLAPDLRPSHKRVSVDLAELGDVLTYTLVLTNAGAVAADPLRLVDPIPACCTYLPGSFRSSSPQGGYDVDQRAVTWSGRGDVGAPLTLTFALTVDGAVAPCGPLLVNRAQVEDPLGGGLTLVASTPLRLPDLSASQKIAGASQAAPGELLTYTVIARNRGGYAPQVQMVDPLPPAMKWVGEYGASQGTVGYDPASHEVGWAVGPLQEDQEATVTFQVQIDGAARRTITNAARLGHGGGWLTKEASVEVWPPRSPRLYLPLILKNR